MEKSLPATSKPALSAAAPLPCAGTLLSRAGCERDGPGKRSPERPRLAQTGAHVHSCSRKYRPNSTLFHLEKTEGNTAFLLYYWLSLQAFGRAPFGVVVLFYFVFSS